MLRQNRDNIAEKEISRIELLKTYIDLNKITDYGYDGFIAKMNNKGDKEYAVVNSKQVKIIK